VTSRQAISASQHSHYFSMAQMIDTGARDTGLQQSLSKCQELIIKQCMDKLGMTCLSEFVDFATEAKFALLGTMRSPQADWHSYGLAWIRDGESTGSGVLMLAREGVLMNRAGNAATQDANMQWSMNSAKFNASHQPIPGSSANNNRPLPPKPTKRHKPATVTVLRGGQALCKKRNDERGCTRDEEDCPDNRAHLCDALVDGRACGRPDCFRWRH
jgi:hypothetical protein